MLKMSPRLTAKGESKRKKKGERLHIVGKQYNQGVKKMHIV